MCVGLVMAGHDLSGVVWAVKSNREKRDIIVIGMGSLLTPSSFYEDKILHYGCGIV